MSLHHDEQRPSNDSSHELPSVRQRPKIPFEQKQSDATEGSNAGQAADSSQNLTALERFVVRRLREFIDLPEINIVIGDEEQDGSKLARHSIHIRDKSTLYQLIRDPEYAFLEGYTLGTIEISGDLVELLTLLKQKHSIHQHVSKWSHLIYNQLRRRRSRCRQGNVAYHYDIGNDFYRLWLDEQLLYTCAYFESASLTLEQAQVAKMDYVCRKLRLRSGERVIEAGCGWGALAIHMARHYGVTVRATNLSKEQLDYARCRAKREGLESRVEFIEADWTEIADACDAFVSVGMLEHVGPENYRHLGQIIGRSLGANGRGLIHTIAQNTTEPLSPWIEHRIFPGAQPPTLTQMMDIFEPYELSVIDLENLRPHYAETIRHWLDRFENSTQIIRKTFDERFVRMWRIYLASSIAAFQVGSLQLYQVLFAPLASMSIPATRDDIYGDPLRGLGERSA
ncbi:MAG: class I SAM-dependent methyltransferase [Planctomycetaceae bacterium]